MSDETDTPESDTPETETPETETAEADAPTADAPTQPVGAATTESAAATSAPDRRGVFVPRWLAILLGLVIAVGLVGGGGFWLGRESADDDGQRGEQSERPLEPREVPSAPGGPNLPDIPDAPRAPQGRQLLGVAVEQADGGAAVVRVASGSPADDAGIEVGDVITEVDGDAVSGPEDVVAAVRSHESGDAITITYERDGETVTVRVTLADLSSGGDSAS